jgi:Uma2 family endonuclease
MLSGVEAATTIATLSVEDYPDGERRSEIRHEYIGGAVYAMAGASIRHNIICQNLLIALRSHLRGKPCQVFVEGVKLRLRVAEEDIFYYPDVMVACDTRDKDEYYREHPKVLIEVLSPDTERIDRREKFQSYTTVDSLEEYILVAQNPMEATVFRRANQWRPEIIRDSEQTLRIPSLEFAVKLSAIYEGV